MTELRATRGKNLYPFLEHRIDQVTWLLEEVRISSTELEVYTTLRSVWPSDIPYSSFPQFPSPHCLALSQKSWWEGFAEITDDAGTRYRWCSSAVDLVWPLYVSVDKWSGIRISQRHRERWVPGPPPEARRLYLKPQPTLSVERPTKDLPPWPVTQLSLGIETCTISIADDVIDG